MAQTPKRPVTVTLPSDREVTVTREFDAPAQLIWDAHTVPEMMQRWLYGPPGWSMPECRVDLRVGGRYRYVWQSDDGRMRFGAYGEHEAIEAPRRIVTLEQMDGLDGGPLLDEPPLDKAKAARNTLTLEARGGRTVLTLNMCFPSKEVRDAAVQSGMTDGMGMGYDRLDGILAEAA